MNILNKFLNKKSKNNSNTEKKTQAAGGYSPLLAPWLYGQGEHPILYPSEAIIYMVECAPVWTALHRIAESVASIEPKVRDKKTGDFLDYHPVLDLLKKPDADITYSEFIENCVQWWCGTGNIYIQALGFIQNPPKSLRVMPSYSTTVVPSGDGYADTMITRLLMICDTYNRKEVDEYGRVRYRYYANEFNELYQIRSFNPQVGSTMVYGLSPLNAVFYEMRQYIEAAKSNLSTLIRAAKLSGYWKYEGLLTDPQRQQIQAQINNVYSGAQNAGRAAVFDQKMTFEDLMKNVRDMDYGNTAKYTSETIYKALNIPLPLINPDSMTYSNYEIAQYSFYKDAVIPLRKRLDQELTNFLMPRYEKEDLYELTFNPKDIPQLEPERNAQMQLKKNTGIYTINEMRKEGEYKPLDGGQYIYGGMGSIPIATDNEDDFSTGQSNYNQQEITDRSNQQSQQDQDIDAEKQSTINKASKEDFIRRLKLQINKDGTPRFTEEEIMQLADKHYG